SVVLAQSWPSRRGRGGHVEESPAGEKRKPASGLPWPAAAPSTAALGRLVRLTRGRLLDPLALAREGRMSILLRRRAFIGALGGAAALPLAVRAQQRGQPVIGYLSGGTARERAGALPGFSKGLSEMGYVEGRNVAIEFRWAQNDPRRLPELAADLVRRRV